VLTPIPQRMMHPRGRLLVEDGEARFAAPRASREWHERVDDVDVARVPSDVRDALAARWERDAALEHASVAAFARVSLELMAFGAPAELVEAAHRAAIEEIAHARVSYALASRYAGRDIGPGPLAVDLSHASRTLADFARDTFVHGCVGETVAAVAARRASELEDDDGLRAVLEGIASDEEGHAELAWRMLAWAAREGGEDVRRAIDAAAIDLDREPGEDVLRAQMIAEVVRPCLAALSARLSAQS
jgi:hypothetical protein